MPGSLERWTAWTSTNFPAARKRIRTLQRGCWMSELVVGLLTIWFLFLGLAIMVRQHRRFFHWSWRQAQRPFRWAWARWRTEIMSFFFGVGLAKIVQWNAVFWPVAIAAGIILAVWLLGLAITHFAITPNGARVYI